MKKFRVTRSLLLYTYILMLGICVILNITGKSIEKENIIISAVMFVLVGIIFGYAYKKLGIVSKVTKELKDASNNIKSTYIQQKFLLWSFYKFNKESNIFRTGYLSEPYQNYCSEMARIEAENDLGYQCEIEDYINQAIVEDFAKKNLLALVPGSMTGLGILGTFIGLTLGLQNFGTGTTDEIINSIPTLMEGIKVAFHTSIYGMVFSLSFNFAYKSVFEDALAALDDFLDEFRGKVCPDSQSENERLAIELGNKQSDTILSAEDKLEKELVSCLKELGTAITDMKKAQDKQIELLTDLPNRIAAEVNLGVTQSIGPQFVEFGDILSKFADKQADKQNNSVSALVNKFMQALNKAVGDNFDNLRSVIEETCSMQKDSNQYMLDIIHQTGKMTSDIQKVNEISSGTIERFSSYIELIEKLQAIINDNFMNVNVQLDANAQINEKLAGYVDNLTEYERRISESTSSFAKDMSEQTEILGKVSSEISSSSQDNLRILAEKAEEYNATLAEAAKKQIGGMLAVCQQISEECSSSLVVLSQSASKSNNEFTEAAKKQIESVKSICADISDECSKSIAVLTSSASNNNDAIADSAKKQIQQIIQVSSNVSNEFDRASASLAKTATSLNGNLEASLEKVLGQFDGELSKVASQLSESVSEVNDSTKQVPSVVAGAYDAMYRVFADMSKEMEKMRNEMNSLVSGLQPIIERINSLEEKQSVSENAENKAE